MYYRSNYRPKKKSRGSKKVITVIAAVIIVTVATILFGHYLKGKAEDSKENSSPMPDEVTVNEEELSITAAPSVSAYPVSLKGLTVDNAEKLAEELSAKGYSGVALRLTDENGRPAYTSETTSIFNSERAAKDDENDPEQLPALREITAAFHKLGLRTVGAFTAGDFSADSASDEALRSYEIALICELPSLGIDEAVLFGVALEGDGRADALEYAEKIRTRIPDFPLGVAVELDRTNDAGIELQLLISKFTFLAVVLDIPEDSGKIYDSVTEQISASTVVLTKHSPRVVLPYMNDEATLEEILAVNATHIDNWMIY